MTQPSGPVSVFFEVPVTEIDGGFLLPDPSALYEMRLRVTPGSRDLRVLVDSRLQFHQEGPVTRSGLWFNKGPEPMPMQPADRAVNIPDGKDLVRLLFHVITPNGVETQHLLVRFANAA